MASYKKYFVGAVTSHFPNAADVIVSRMDELFTSISVDTNFAATSKNPMDKRLDFSAYFLALIQTLNERGEHFDTIRKICLEVVTEYVRPKNKIQRILKLLPAKMANTWVADVA